MTTTISDIEERSTLAVKILTQGSDESLQAADAIIHQPSSTMNTLYLYIR